MIRNISSIGLPRLRNGTRKIHSHFRLSKLARFFSSKSLSDEGDLEHAKFGQFMDSNTGDGSNRSAMKFVERVQIEVKGGMGGNGCISNEVLSPGKKRPNGGNGGKGGSVFVVGSSQVESLHFPTYHFNAGNGNNGSSNGMTGRRGKDVHIHVPLGTIVTENIPEEYAEYFYYDDGKPYEVAKARGIAYTGENIEENRNENENGKEEEEEERYDDYTLEELLKEEGVSASLHPEGGAFHSFLVDNEGEDKEEEEEDGNEELWAIDQLNEGSDVSREGKVVSEASLQRAKRRKRRKRKSRHHYSHDGLPGDEGGEGEDNLLPALRREIMVDGETYLVAQGGDFGIGNKVLAGSSKYRARSLPQSRTPGRPGMQRSLILELKLIADVGLVGYPNAGKSTLLRSVSNAKPRVAPYHFTTLRPYLGVLKYNNSKRATFADIPGLIDGAHANRGLGHTFLKHIERTKVLLYVLDGASTEGRDPGDDLENLMEELRLYNPELMQKPSLVFANKIDLRGMFYKDRGVSKRTTVLDEAINIDISSVRGGDDDFSKEDGGAAYQGIEEEEAQYTEMGMSKLERVARDAGLTIIDGSADSGEGIGKLAMAVRAKIDESSSVEEDCKMTTETVEL